MSLFISLVGQQPGAVAVAAATLNKHDPISRVLLLPTMKTLPMAEGLASLLGTWGMNPDILVIGDPSRSTRPLPWPVMTLANTARRVKEEIDDAAAQGMRVYFDASAGMTWHLVFLRRALSDSMRHVTALIADDRYLNTLEKGQEWPLANVGFETLLELHQVKARTRGKIPLHDSGRELWIDTSLSGPETPDQPYFFSGIYEQHGRLFAVTEINVGEKREKEAIAKAKLQARKFKALVRDPKVLNHLRPRITLATDYKPIRDRLIAYDIETRLVGPGTSLGAERWIEEWKKGNVEAPGRSLPGPRDRAPRPDIIVYRGGGGDGNPLVVCMGNDPSPTLLALTSHRPAKALLCYDAGTPFVEAITNRLLEKISTLPVGDLFPVPVNHLGDGLREQVASHLSGQDKSTWFANCSAGSNAQAWILSGLEGVIPCTLHNATATVKRTDGAVVAAYTLPPLDTQAYVCGGPWRRESGGTLADLDENRDFLEAMVHAVAECARSDRVGHVELRNIAGLIFEEFGPKERGHLEITLARDGREYRGRLPGLAVQGFWLEPLIAFSLYQAGGDKVREMIFPLVWEHLTDMRGSELKQFRTELDVALIWGTSFLGVSCKKGFRNEEGYLDAREEIVAVARTGVGRFCIPVLVGPVPWRRSRLTLPRERLLEIPLTDLDRPENLRQSIEGFITGQRTGD